MPSTSEPPVRLTSTELQERVRRTTELLKRQGLPKRTRLKLSNLRLLDQKRLDLRKKFPDLDKMVAEQKEPSKESSKAPKE